jgi:release factor glutamine methyltransferase
MTVRDAIAEAKETIDRRDAEVLLAHLLGKDQAWLLAHPEFELHEVDLMQLRDLTRKRAAHEPLQYLTGMQEFFGLALKVTPDTLIPRPETEHLVEAVLAWARQQPESHPLRILDIGTGTGAIALALATQLPTAKITACDVSAAALSVAAENAAKHGLAPRLRFVESDLLAAFAREIEAGARFDVIASNPPYVPTGDALEMQAEVRDHEPPRALFAGADGLDIYRRLIPQAYAALRPGGLLAMEFGYGQREALRVLLEEWADVRFIDDYAGIPRVVLANC